MHECVHTPPLRGQRACYRSLVSDPRDYPGAVIDPIAVDNDSQR